MKNKINKFGRTGDIMRYFSIDDEGNYERLLVRIIKTRKEKSRYDGLLKRVYTFEVLETRGNHQTPIKKKGETFEGRRNVDYDWEYERALREIWPVHRYNYWDMVK